MSRYVLSVFLALCMCFSAIGQELQVAGSRKAVRTSGDVLVFVTPVASLATVLALQDWEGLKQGALSGVTTVGLTYALKYIVKKERPDRSDTHSFPSMSLWLEMGYSGLRCFYLRRLESCLRKET